MEANFIKDSDLIIALKEGDAKDYTFLVNSYVIDLSFYKVKKKKIFNIKLIFNINLTF